jgi:hypothetical protein
MRKLIVLGALLTALFGLALPSLPGIAGIPGLPASASQSVPTCLISNGGGGGHFTKTLICVELLDQGDGHAGSGSYSPGDNSTVHRLTESVEFQPLGRGSVWLPLASTRQQGAGRLTAVTRTVELPAPGYLRACTRTSTDTNSQLSQLCSNPT